jgi:hypothetical protein
MSTPTHARRSGTTRAAALPRPRPPVEPLAGPPAESPEARRSGNRQTSTDEPATLFGRHAWLVPAVTIACIVAVFVAMVLLTWLAGGTTPFD